MAHVWDNFKTDVVGTAYEHVVNYTASGTQYAFDPGYTTVYGMAIQSKVTETGPLIMRTSGANVVVSGITSTNSYVLSYRGY